MSSWKRPHQYKFTVKRFQPLFKTARQSSEWTTYTSVDDWHDQTKLNLCTCVSFAHPRKWLWVSKVSWGQDTTPTASRLTSPTLQLQSIFKHIPGETRPRINSVKKRLFTGKPPSLRRAVWCRSKKQCVQLLLFSLFQLLDKNISKKINMLAYFACSPKRWLLICLKIFVSLASLHDSVVIL